MTAMELSPPAFDPDRHVTGRMICAEPPIWLGGLHGRADDLPLGPASVDALLRTARPHYFFFCPQWSFAGRLSGADFLRVNVRALSDRAERFPQHRYVVLLNDAADQLILREAAPAVETYVWNTNCTADPDAFACGPPAERDIRAVYIGRHVGYKRLELAAEVEGLSLVTKAAGGQSEALRRLLPKAAFPNFGADGAYRPLSTPEVAALLARARTGLILSEIEGQNRAAMEYLLSGAPVVTTANHGGRDRFLTPANSVFVNPEPGAVAEGVRWAASAGFEPHAIRAEAVRALRFERLRLVEIVNRVLARDGEAPVALEELDLPHKASSLPCRVREVFSALGRPLPPPG